MFDVPLVLCLPAAFQSYFQLNKSENSVDPEQKEVR